MLNNEEQNKREIEIEESQVSIEIEADSFRCWKFWRWLALNRGPLASKATALTTSDKCNKSWHLHFRAIVHPVISRTKETTPPLEEILIF